MLLKRGCGLLTVIRYTCSELSVNASPPIRFSPKYSCSGRAMSWGGGGGGASLASQVDGWTMTRARSVYAQKRHSVARLLVTLTPADCHFGHLKIGPLLLRHRAESESWCQIKRVQT